MRDFSFKKYIELLENIKNSGFHIYTIQSYFLAEKEKNLVKKYIILRHDVDGNIENAERMATLENSLGITATYYFRMKNNLFIPDVVKKISTLGHEIGYHYEHLPDAKGDIKKSQLIFEENLSKLRSIAQVKTVCMHGRPFSKFDSRDYWSHFNLEEYGLIAEPYLNINYKDKYYFTDTGQAWDNHRFNLRDIVESKGSMDIKNTNDLIRLINNSAFDKAAFLVHTNRWVDHYPLWLFYTIGNGMVNKIKELLKMRRKI